MKVYLNLITFALLSTLLIGCSSDDTASSKDNSDGQTMSQKKEDSNSENQKSSDSSDPVTDNQTNADGDMTSDDSANSDTPIDNPPSTAKNDDDPFGGSFGSGDGVGGSGTGDAFGSDSGPSTSTKTEESSYNFHAYKNLDALLKKYVSASGKVNYSGIKSDKAKLDKIIKEFKDNYPASGWSKNQKLAYWINAYNIFTIKLIVDNHPTSSITKITAKPWDKKFVKLGSHTYSLNNVENDIIRKKFNEPRIHFALNCASESCPVLLNAAYTSGNLQSKLTSQTKRFLKDTSKNKFDNKKKIYISKIFEWYKEDFTKNGSTVVKFINKYRTEQLESPKILYTEYSWDLND